MSSPRLPAPGNRATDDSLFVGALAVVTLMAALFLLTDVRVELDRADRANGPVNGGPTGARGAAAATYTIAAAGDIACDTDAPDYNDGAGGGSNCRQQATSNLLVTHRPAAVLALGDLQYDNGQLTSFERVYDRTWGRVKSVTRPVPGNHDYHTPGAAGYYDYFASLAGPRGKALYSFRFGHWRISLGGRRARGFYSFDLGNWHIIALNSECYFRARCALEQERWLRADLAKSAEPCQIAYWHRPRFTSGHHGGSEADRMARLWRIVADHKVEVVLNGHDDDYERFAPMDANGQRDPDGVREFVVGTGGKEFRGFAKTLPTSEVRDTSGTAGVLFLTLKPNGYDWRMQPIAGGTFSDGGSGTCH